MMDKEIINQMFNGRIALTVSYSAEATKPFFATVVEGAQYHSESGVTAIEAVTNLFTKLADSLQARIAAAERLELGGS
jgi:hypothetical protein